MSLASLLVHTVTVKRLGASSGVKKVWEAAGSGVPCLIQPLDPEPQEASFNSWGKDFRAWFLPTQDVREGDQLVDADGRTFGVRGVRLRNYGSADMRHLEARLGLDGGSA